ncbi:MAG: DUF6734 family protein [Methanomassiliicoccales archaeon]|jgi:hypothetical protein
MIRKAIYSQWSKPFGSTTGSFLNEEVARACWSLSVENSKKYFGCVELVCDEASRRTLIDKFGIKFDKVHNVLDESLSKIDPSFWVMGKFYAYKIQQEPFIHVDSDFIMFDEMPESLLKSPFVFANRETVNPLYQIGMKIIDGCPIKPSYYNPKLCFDDICCVGVIGVNDLDTMKEWINSIFDLITNQKNTHFWKFAGNRAKHEVCWLLEQYMIANLIKFKKITPMFLTDHFEPWVHLLGETKRNPDITSSLVKRYEFLNFVRRTSKTKFGLTDS